MALAYHAHPLAVIATAHSIFPPERSPERRDSGAAVASVVAAGAGTPVGILIGRKIEPAAHVLVSIRRISRIEDIGKRAPPLLLKPPAQVANDALVCSIFPPRSSFEFLCQFRIGPGDQRMSLRSLRCKSSRCVVAVAALKPAQRRRNIRFAVSGMYRSRWWGGAVIPRRKICLLRVGV